MHSSFANTVCRVLAVTVLLTVSLSAQAVTIDLRNAGGNGGGYGNTLNFSSGSIALQVKAFAETGLESPAGSGWFRFNTAEAWSWSTGIGICNRLEGTAGNYCDDNEHEVDTVSRDDLLVFIFNQPVMFQSVTVDPYDGAGSDPNDRDIMYWIGNAPSLPNLATQTFPTLGSMAGFAPPIWSPASSSYNPFTHTLTGIGNILLLSGYYLDRNCKNADVSIEIECEAYKVANIKVSALTAIPLPAAMWAFAPALGLLAALRRRSVRS